MPRQWIMPPILAESSEAAIRWGVRPLIARLLLNRGIEARRQGGTGRSGFQGVRLIRPDYTDDPRHGV